MPDLNIRNVSNTLLWDLKQLAMNNRMTLKDYCASVLERAAACKAQIAVVTAEDIIKAQPERPRKRLTKGLHLPQDASVVESGLEALTRVRAASAAPLEHAPGCKCLVCKPQEMPANPKRRMRNGEQE